MMAELLISFAVLVVGCAMTTPALRPISWSTRMRETYVCTQSLTLAARLIVWMGGLVSPTSGIVVPIYLAPARNATYVLFFRTEIIFDLIDSVGSVTSATTYDAAINWYIPRKLCTTQLLQHSRRRLRSTCGARSRGRLRRTPVSRSTSAGRSRAKRESNHRSRPSTCAPAGPQSSPSCCSGPEP